MELPSWSNPVCLHCSVDARRQISRAIRRDPVGYAAPLRGCPHLRYRTMAGFTAEAQIGGTCAKSAVLAFTIVEIANSNRRDDPSLAKRSESDKMPVADDF